MSLAYDGVEMLPRVLVTRPAEDAPVLANALVRAGMQPVIVPLLERRWQIDNVVDMAATSPDADWVLVTSATAADVLATAAPHAWKDARWAAVGPATASRLRDHGLRADLLPGRATAADLISAMGPLDHQRVVYPRADLASPSTLQALRDAGADLVEVVAYRNVAPHNHERLLHEAIPVDATTLLSGSAARRLAQALTPAHHHALGRIVVIGPSTERVAREEGLDVHAVAEPYSLQGLLSALMRELD